jgi:hypothetical protein
MFHLDPACKLSAKLYDIYLLLCVQWKTPDDGQRNCPKPVEFHSKNTFEKSVHLVGFTIRTHKRLTSMPLTGFEPAIPKNELPQPHALDSAAPAIGAIRHKVM